MKLLKSPEVNEYCMIFGFLSREILQIFLKEGTQADRLRKDSPPPRVDDVPKKQPRLERRACVSVRALDRVRYCVGTQECLFEIWPALSLQLLPAMLWNPLDFDLKRMIK